MTCLQQQIGWRKVLLLGVVCLLGWLFWPVQDDEVPEGEIVRNFGDRNGTRVSRENSWKETTHSRVRVVAPKNSESEFDPYEEWEFEKVLAYFMVPAGRFEARGLSAATAQLQSIYQENSGRTLAISSVVDLGKDQNIVFEHGNISFRRLLGMVATLSGCSVELRGREVWWSAFEERPIEFSPPAHPFPMSSEKLSVLASDPQKLSEYVALFGVTFDSEDLAKRSSVEIEDFLTIFQQEIATVPSRLSAVKTLNQFIRVPEIGSRESVSFLTGDAVDELLRSFAQEKGVDIVTAPSVVSPPGEQAEVFVGREIIFPQEGVNDDEFLVENMGVKLPLSVTVSGLDRLHVQGTFEFTKSVGGSFLDIFLEGQDGTLLDRTSSSSELSFEGVALESDLHFADSGAVLIPVGNEDGHTVYQLLRAHRITPTGEKVLGP